MKQQNQTNPYSQSIFLLTFLFSALLLLTNCTTIQPQKAPEKIQIGAVLPLTGIASIHGQNERQGIDLAVKEINANGGINGKAVEVVYEDDATEPVKSLTAVKKLIEVNEIKIMIGGTWDVLANAIIPEIDRQHSILLSPSALPDTLTVTSPYFYSVHSPVSINQAIFESFLKSHNSRRAAVIVVNNPWGLAHLHAFEKAASQSKTDIIEKRIVQNFDNNDLSTELTSFKAKNPDMVFAAINFNDMALLAKKRIELNLSAQLLAHSNFQSAFEAGRIKQEWAEGVTIFRFSDPSSIDFVSKFNQEYGHKPEIYSDIAYDIMYILKEVIEKQGTGVAGVDDIRKGLSQINYNGASGMIHFGDSYFPENKQPYMEIMLGGKYQKVE